MPVEFIASRGTNENVLGKDWWLLLLLVAYGSRHQYGLIHVKK